MEGRVAEGVQIGMPALNGVYVVSRDGELVEDDARGNGGGGIEDERAWLLSKNKRGRREELRKGL